MPELPEDFMTQLAGTRDDASAFSELMFGTPLHAGQRRFIKNASAEVNFLLPGNSWGKTEFFLRLALWEAWHKKGCEYTDFEGWVTRKWEGLVASFTYPVAGESFNRLDNAYKNNPAVRAIVARIIRSEPDEVELTNGATLYWGSLDGKGKLVEAKRLQRIYVEEVGHIPDFSYTFDNILYPRTMGVSGRIYLFGTPKPDSDPYIMEVFEKGKTGEDPFYFAQVGSVFENEFWPVTEKHRVLSNPRYVKGWQHVHEENEACENLACIKGDHPILTPVGKQVINGEFVLAGGLFFNRLHVARIFEPSDHEVEWVGENHFNSPKKEGHLYMAAFDLGGNKPKKFRGKGSDPTVGLAIDYTTRPWKVVRYDFIEGGTADWEDKYNLMAEVYYQFGIPYLLIDATGQVDSVQEGLERRGVEVDGIQFGGAGNRKFDMLRNLQLCMELNWGETRGVLRCPPIPRMKYELDHYVLPDDDIRQDCVMTLGMVCDRIAEEELPPSVAGETF